MNPDQPPPAEEKSDRPHASKGLLLSILERGGLLFVFGILILVFSILKPETYPTAANWQTIAITQSVIAVSALALIVPLTTGRFDVSVGSVVGISSIAAAAAMSKAGLPLAAAVVVGTGIGALIGTFNGLIIAYLGVNSIITTLATSTIIGGLIQAYTNGVAISADLSPDLLNLAITKVFGAPMLFVITIVISVIVWYLLTQTPFGRYLVSIGDNAASARLVGTPVRGLVFVSFVASGTLAGLGGVLLIAQQGSANPQVGGIEFMLPALAAAFLGATAFHPGRYNVPGTLLGLFFVGAAVNGLALLGAKPWVEPVFNGTIVLVAVAMSTLIRRRRTGASELGD